MTTTSPRPHPWLAAAALSLALLGLAVDGAAQDRAPAGDLAPWSPVRATSARLSMMDAVRLALDHSPTMALVRQDTLTEKARSREASGTFDGSLQLETYFQYAQGELLRSQVDSLESQRNLFRILSREFDRVAQNLIDQLGQTDGFVFLDCGAAGIDVTIGSSPICLSGRSLANALLYQQLAEEFSFDLLEEAVITANRNEALNLADILRLVALDSRGNLRRLGTVPEVEEETTLYLQLGYAKAFRNGVVVSPAIGFEAVKDNYLHKPDNSSYGGKGVPDSYTVALGLSLDVPLGKGRGRVSAAAPERAAKLSYDASLSSQAQALSETALQTLLAFWRLVGAQEELAVLESSAARQRQLLTLAEELVKVDEVAAVDLDQVRARLAQTGGVVAQARQAVLLARHALARVIGLEVTRPEDAPFAAGSFPAAADAAALASWRVEDLAGVAESNRRDLTAARILAESADILTKAAQADLRRTFDLEFQVGYTGLYEGGSVTRPLDLLEGLDEAFFGGLTGPSARVVLTVELPFANNAALGRLEQARATAQQSAIQARDLERVIDDNTHQLIGSLRRAADEVARRQASVDLYRSMLGDEMERYKLGQSTTIDLILTEERQTSALLSLVAAREAYASLLAQLRHELGVLIQGRIEDGRVVVEGVDPLGLDLVAQRG